MTFDYDLFVIGAGTGGIAASKQAAAYGMRVAVAEIEAIGGTCVNRGCIPKKFIVYAADFALQDRFASDYGWSECQRRFDWSRLIAAVHQQVEKRHQSYLQTFQKAGIELIRGHATIVDPNTVAVDGRKFTAKNILIAVGGQPLKPREIVGIEHAITSREMFQLPQLPKKLAIVGGGYIGVEFASMMNAFGVEVTLIDTAEQILSGFDDDLRSGVQNALSQRGIKFFGNSTTKEIKQNSQGLELIISGRTKTITADTILIAIGRNPNTSSLGLENANIEMGEKGAITVDEYNRTSQENIFAVGDCISKVPLTPVARTEGQIVVRTMFGQPQKINYDYVPSAVFSRPEVATVGMTEAKGREKFGEVQCFRTQFEPLFYSMTNQSEQAMMKLVVDGSNRVLGAHMVGEHAADIIQSLAVAIKQGVTRQEIEATIGIHPTTGEEFLLLD